MITGQSFKAILVCAALLTSTVARANDVATVAFFAALKIAQVQAMRATADYYQAIGVGVEAQQTTGLANRLENGGLGGDDSVQAFQASALGLKARIDDYRARGKIPTAQQLELARKAKAKLDSADVALGAAIAAGIVAAIDGGNFLEKLAKTAIFTGIALKMTEPFGAARDAARQYTELKLSGESGFQEVSKNLKPSFSDL
ncbi:MAG: hypothetical protein WCO11_11095 [Sphingomonadales bacterium]